MGIESAPIEALEGERSAGPADAVGERMDRLEPVMYDNPFSGLLEVAEARGGNTMSSLTGDQAPQHFLYFLPLPQGHGSLRPIFVRHTGGGAAASAGG